MKLNPTTEKINVSNTVLGRKQNTLIALFQLATLLLDYGHAQLCQFWLQIF